MSRKFMFVAMLLLMLVPFGAQAQDDEPLRVGIVTDLSGALSIYGVEFTNGFNLGLLYAAGIDPSEYDSIEDALADVEVAGNSLEVLVRDYGSENPVNDPDNAAAATRELVETEFVDVIVGPPSSSAAVQVQTLTSPDEYDLLFMGGPGASPAITGENFHINTFRICRNSLQDAQTLAQQGDVFGETYIVLATDNAFGRGTAAGFDLAFPAAGIQPAAEGIYAPSDTTEFTPFLQQAMDSGADTLVQVWAGAGGIPLAQQTIELGVLDAMTIATGTNSNDITAAAPPPVGSLAYIVYNYTLPDTEVNDWLVEKHIEAYNDVPDLFTECGFATAQALVLGLEATEGDPFPEAMIPALEGLSFEGPKGTYTIQAGDHQALAPQYMIEFTGTEDVEVGDTTLTLPTYNLVAEVSPENSAPLCLLAGDFAERCAMNDMMGDE